MHDHHTPLANRQMLSVLFAIAIITIIIAGINFTNFTTALSPSECRRKEIGIRKVVGCSTMGIVAMFNKGYLIILLICFVIAAPIAWFAVSRWLENFAYRTPMYGWVYVLALVAVAAITALTVTFQSWRVASDDPVKSIKTE